MTVDPAGPATGVTLIGTERRDVLTGTAYDDVIFGKGGRDVLTGLAGNDVFLFDGEDGLDAISGGAGYDVVRGGVHDDTFLVTSNLDNLAGIEEIDGGGGENTIAATSSNDVLDFSNIMLKNIHAIESGNGHDRITGSLANDTFELGQGRDTLVVILSGGHDVVEDFSAGSHNQPVDMIDVSAFGFTSMSQVFSRLQQQGDDVVLTLDASTSVTLEDVTRVELRDWNFRIA